MFLAFKGNGTKDIFQKHGLKYILSVGIIFQMYHTEPPNGVRMPFHCPVDLFFAPHSRTSSVLSPVMASPAASSPSGAVIPPSSGSIAVADAVAVLIDKSQAAATFPGAAADPFHTVPLAAVTDTVPVFIHKAGPWTGNRGKGYDACTKYKGQCQNACPQSFLMLSPFVLSDNRFRLHL